MFRYPTHSVPQLNFKDLLRRTTNYKYLKVKVNREEHDHFRVEQLSILQEVRLKLSQERWGKICREENQHSREWEQHEQVYA